MAVGLSLGVRVTLARGLRQVADWLRDPEPLASGEVHVWAEPAVAATAVSAPAQAVPAQAVVDLPPPAPEVQPAATAPTPQADQQGEGTVYDDVVEALQTIFDPEIPVDIYELGLIYDIDVRDDTAVHIRMTLTSPNCPAAQSLPDEVKAKVSAVPGVGGAEVEVVFDPPWSPELMSEEARLMLNV